MASTTLLATDSMVNFTKSVMVTNHTYYPLEVEIAHLVANEMSMPVLLTIFSALCAGIVLVTKFVVDRLHPHLKKTEKAAIWWFVICTYCAQKVAMRVAVGWVKCPRGTKYLAATLGSSKAVRVWANTFFFSWLNSSLFRGLFLLEPYPYGSSARSVWSIVEGVCAFRLAIPHF